MNPRLLPSALLGLLLATPILSGEETVLLRAQLPQKEYELQPVDHGVQRLVVPSAANVTWEISSGTEKLTGDSLVLTVPVAANERLHIVREALAGSGLRLIVSKTTAGTVMAVSTPITPETPAPASHPATPTVTGAPGTGHPASEGTHAASDTSKPDKSNNADVAKIAEEIGLSPKDVALVQALEPKLADSINFDPASKTDFAIPESPAAAILGQDTQILSPTTPRETVTSLLSDFDSDGKLKTGFSIGVTPYTIFRKSPVSLSEYNDKDMVRFLTRLQLSLAAKAGTPASGATAATPTTFGIGLSGVFYDGSDLRLDPKLREDLNTLVRPIAEALFGLHEKIARNEISEIPDVPKDYLEKYDDLKSAAERVHWNAPAMGFGLALRLQSASGNIKDAKEDGGAAWLNMAMPGIGAFDENSQFLFNANYRYRDNFNRNGVTGKENSFNLGAQWRVGTDSFHGYAEAFYHWRRPNTGPATSETTIEVGAEKRLLESLWLNLAWSNDDSLTGGKVIKTGLRYGFGKAATMSAK